MSLELPAPKPTRIRRWPLRVVPFALAGSALFAPYWFTHPPELVWWKSPEIYKSGGHFRVLLPYGWKAAPVGQSQGTNTRTWTATYSFAPGDATQWYLCWMTKEAIDKKANVMIVAGQELGTGVVEAESCKIDLRINAIDYWAARSLTLPRDKISVDLRYERTNESAFNRTHKQICNSLTIE